MDSCFICSQRNCLMCKKIKRQLCSSKHQVQAGVSCDCRNTSWQCTGRFRLAHPEPELSQGLKPWEWERAEDGLGRLLQIPGANRTSQAIAGLIGINSHAVFRRLAFHLDQRKDNDGDRTGGSMCTKLPMFWSLLSWSV